MSVSKKPGVSQTFTKRHDKLWHNPFSQVPINMKDNRHFSLRKSLPSSKTVYWAPAYYPSGFLYKNRSLKLDHKTNKIWTETFWLKGVVSRGIWKDTFYKGLLSLQFRLQSFWSRILSHPWLQPLQASIINQVGWKLGIRNWSEAKIGGRNVKGETINPHPWYVPWVV